MRLSGFDEARDVEDKALSMLLPWMRNTGNAVAVPSVGGGLEKDLQEFGDVLWEVDDQLRAVEVKAEVKSTGNFFVEVWSNRSGLNPGWVCKTKADYIAYVFLDIGWVFMFSSSVFREWGKKLWGYPYREQNKYTQKNDTWGLCVPIEAVRDRTKLVCAELHASHTPFTDVFSELEKEELEPDEECE